MNDITSSHDNLTIAGEEPTYEYTIATAGMTTRPTWSDSQAMLEREDERIFSPLITDNSMVGTAPRNNRSIEKTRKRRAKNKAARVARRKNRK